MKWSFGGSLLYMESESFKSNLIARLSLGDLNYEKETLNSLEIIFYLLLEKDSSHLRSEVSMIGETGKK